MILVIAYGNPLRRDDGVGWKIARRLQKNSVPGAIQIEVRQQLTPELAEPVSRAARVVFVDARAGGCPGEVSCRRVFPAEGPLPAIGHVLSPKILLALSEWIYGRVPEAFVCSVVGSQFELGTSFSQEVQQALPVLSALVGDAISVIGPVAATGL
jgi:hydrogenase maturation protease